MIMWKACCLAKSGKISAESFVEAVWSHFRSRPPLGEVAIKAGLLNMKQLFEVLEHQAEHGGPFGESAVELGYLTHVQLAETLLKQEEIAMTTEDILINMGELVDDELVNFETVESCNFLEAKKLESIRGRPFTARPV